MNDSDLERTLKLIPSFVSNKYHEQHRNVAFWIVREDGTTLGDVFPQVCHQGLHRLLHFDPKLSANDRQPVAIINSIQELLVPKTTALRFYEWLLNLSPYRNCFVSKDAERMLEEHVVIGDCEAPCNLLADAMIATRTCTENYNIGIHNTLASWNRLVELGVHPDKAFIASNILVRNGDALYLRPYPYAHAAILNPDMSWNRFVTNQPINIGMKYKKIKTYDYQRDMPQSIWHGDRFPLTELLTEVALSASFKPKTNNPFDVANSVKEYPFDKAMEAIALTLNQDGELNAQAA
jgi:hypothetical protein